MSKIITSLALVSLLVSFAPAETMTFSYSGIVGQVLNSPPAPFTAAQVGDPFRVDYALDVSTPDHDTADNIGTFSGAVESYTVTIGGASASTTLGGVNTVNAGGFAPEDVYAAIGIFEDFTTSLSFKDASGEAIGGQDDLSTIDLSGFDDRTFILLNGLFPSVTGTLNVPEPNSLVIVCIGVVGLLLQSRRHSNVFPGKQVLPSRPRGADRSAGYAELGRCLP